MRKSTLNFYYFIKWLEMAVLTIFTTLIVSSGVYVIRKEAEHPEHDDPDMQL